MNFETIAIRSQLETTQHREHSTPLFITSSFTFEDAEHGAAIFADKTEGNLYSRFSNPSVDEFTNKLCLLEECEFGVATASGMAAVFTCLLTHLKSGDHIVASKEIFGNSSHIIKELLPNYGIEFSFINAKDNEAWSRATKQNTKMIFVETPANPTLDIVDLTFLSELSTSKEIILVVDNCFATPYLQKPILFGADIVIHSATKYIDGQGRVLGGAIVGKEKYVRPCYNFVRRTGASLSPFNAWVLSKSLETLGLRMDRHSSNAATISEFLSQHYAVSKVIYPHDRNFPQFELAKNQMSQGGGLLGIELEGGLEKSMTFLNALKLFSLTANLGDSRSIATHPSSTTHAKLNNQDKLNAGISDGYLRLSIGLENIDDLISDIDQALKISNT